MSEWQNVQLGDHIKVKHGYAFQGEHFTDHGHYIVLTPGNFIESGGFKSKSGAEKYYSASPPSEFVLGKGALVIAMTEQAQGLLGSSALIPADGTYLHNQRIGLVMQRSAETDKRFLYYLFNTSAVRNQIQATATGSKVRHTAPARVEAVSVPIPPLPVQQKIAAILSAYDDLIQNNDRHIKILEEVAERIYREWFVEFRYPGHDGVAFVDSELGPIPEGWKVATLSSLATCTMGQSPPSSAYNRDGAGLPFHQGVGSYGDHFPIHDVFSTEGGRLAEDGDILMSVRAPVGRINIADRTLILGRGVAGIRPSSAPWGFLLQALTYFFREEDIMGNGSIFKSVTRRDVEGLPLIWPGRTMALHYSDIVEPMWRELRLLTAESKNLRATRDLLLPRLISGEVDVSHLDIAIPEIAA